MQTAAISTDEDLSEVLPPGRYWVGDLCYVFSDDAWDLICNVIDGDGIFVNAAGIKIGVLHTMWGDGLYYDSDYREFPVDAGLIGCVLLSDTSHTGEPGDNVENGYIVDFPNSFDVTNQGGVLYFDDIVVIDTRMEDDYDEEEDVAYEDGVWDDD